MLAERQLARVDDAEACLLSSVILDAAVLDDVAHLVRPDDFGSKPMGDVFAAMLEIYNSGKTPDPLTIERRLKKQPVPVEGKSWSQYIAEGFDLVPTTANAVWYASQIRSASTLRKLAMAGSKIYHDATDPHADHEAVTADAERLILDVIDNRLQKSEGTTLQDALFRSLDVYNRRKAGAIPGALSTGFPDLDKQLCGGLRKGELIILAGRPSMGKTALATNIASNVTIRQSLPAMFVSLEMGELELTDRILSAESLIPGGRLKDQRFMKAGDDALIADTVNRICGSPMVIFDDPMVSVTDIGSLARRCRRKFELSLLVIDYLQLIRPENPREPREQQVSAIARRLKGLARSLQIPVLCLAQLNRQVESAGNNRPKLSNLRESGAIEQDADVVMFVHRESYYQTGEQAKQREHEAVLIVAKNRNGGTGDVPLHWQKKYTRFDSVAPEDRQQRSDRSQWESLSTEDNDYDL